MPKLLRASMLQKCIGCGSCMLACARMRYRSLSLDKSAIRIRTAGGVQTSPVADICLACSEPACAAVCSAGALVPVPYGGVRVHRSLGRGADISDPTGIVDEQETVRLVHGPAVRQRGQQARTQPERGSCWRPRQAHDGRC